MDVLLPAIILVLIGAIFLACAAGVASLVIGFLLLFWPAILAVALAIILADAGADAMAAICLIGGIGANLVWWLRLVAGRGRTTSKAPTTDRQADLKQQFINRAKHAFGGEPAWFVSDIHGRSAIAVDPEAGKLLLWTSRPGLVHVIDGQAVVDARAHATRTDGPDHTRVELKIRLHHPIHTTSVCFLSGGERTPAAEVSGALQEAQLWERRIHALSAAQVTGLRPSEANGHASA